MINFAKEQHEQLWNGLGGEAGMKLLKAEGIQYFTATNDHKGGLEFKMGDSNVTVYNKGSFPICSWVYFVNVTHKDYKGPKAYLPVADADALLTTIAKFSKN